MPWTFPKTLANPCSPSPGSATTLPPFYPSFAVPLSVTPLSDTRTNIDLGMQSHQSSNSTICGGWRLVGEGVMPNFHIRTSRPTIPASPAPATCGTPIVAPLLMSTYIAQQLIGGTGGTGGLTFDTCFQVGALGPSCIRDLHVVPERPFCRVLAGACVPIPAHTL